MSAEWERAGAVWLGSEPEVSSALRDQARSWIAGVPSPILDSLSAGRVSVYLVHRLRDLHEAYGGGPGWEPPGVYSPGAWKEGRRWRRLVIMAEEWIQAGGSAWQSTLDHPWMEYVFRHEVGHAWDDVGFGRRESFAEPFRSTYLRERRRALDTLPDADQERLEYFLGHWTFGISEVFAESFAAHFGPLPPASEGGSWEPMFRQAFAGCREIVSGLIEDACLETAA